MNIKEAKNCIMDTVVLYLKKDEFGEYRIPVVRQRPIFLLGAPGVGKTGIMEQVASELGIALVSYSMTHHTRQSALGLPVLIHKNYRGIEADVSEYSMSEIISSLYEIMRESERQEGILFLDEINCVSETLAPQMLQFLQSKVFGRFRVPDGWVIVTAGNPPEYNKSVKEFDIATMDRLKLVEVEPDYQVWREYAINKGLHNSIVSFLDLKKEYFYVVSNTTHGKNYVTARGWEDLSAIITLYEEEGIPVDETLIAQYLNSEMILKEFSAYYELYNKYKADYAVNDLLRGYISEEAVERARNSQFDERLSLLSMLMDRAVNDMRDVVEKTDYLNDLIVPLRQLKEMAIKSDGTTSLMANHIKDVLNGRERLFTSLLKANSLSSTDNKKMKRVMAFLTEAQKIILEYPEASCSNAFTAVKETYDSQLNAVRNQTAKIQIELKSLFDFTAMAFAGGSEMLILVNTLTANKYASRFISTFGSEEYNRYCQELMVTDQMEEIGQQIESAEL